MDTFAFNHDVKPWTLYEDPDIECNQKLRYAIFRIIWHSSLLSLSSFLFPNIQFQNKSLDMKYDPTSTFVAILTQVKLLISGFLRI